MIVSKAERRRLRLQQHPLVWIARYYYASDRSHQVLEVVFKDVWSIDAEYVVERLAEFDASYAGDAPLVRIHVKRVPKLIEALDALVVESNLRRLQLGARKA